MLETVYNAELEIETTGKLSYYFYYCQLTFNYLPATCKIETSYRFIVMN